MWKRRDTQTSMTETPNDQTEPGKMTEIEFRKLIMKSIQEIKH